MSLLAVFMSGLLSGGLTCFAVQGGLLASMLAQSKDDNSPSSPFRQTSVFLIARLIGYTLLGFILGSLGSIFQLSINMRAFIQIAVAIFMVGTALNLIQAHPIFRYFVIKPPKFIFKFARLQTKSQALFAPVFLGLATVLIPCGATQAMMAYALATSSSIQGALVMAVFTLGTSPLFLAVGLAATKVSSSLSTKLTPYAALAIIIIAVYNLIGGLALTGNPTITKTLTEARCIFTICPVDTTRVLSQQDLPSQESTIQFNSNGYQITSGSQIKAGTHVKLNLVNTKGQGCIQAFTIPALNLQQVVRTGQTKTIEFTAPTKPGELTFMCSMGMYKGSLLVV